MVAPITSIRIPTSWGPLNNRQSATAEFKLGVGPCGKEVTRLEMQMNANEVSIAQYTKEGTFKEFIYFNRHLTGRIEVTREGVPA